jgi:hypothetical protein
MAFGLCIARISLVVTLYPRGINSISGGVLAITDVTREPSLAVSRLLQL